MTHNRGYALPLLARDLIWGWRMPVRIDHPPVEPWIYVKQTFDDEEFARTLIPGTNDRYQARSVDGTKCHAGFDIQAPPQERTLFAVCDGTIETPDFGPAYGVQTVLRCAATGRAEGAFYAHQRNRLVSAGDRVEWGQPIGVMGGTSTRKIAVHLHFSWCPTWNVPRFRNAGPQLRAVKEAYMPYTKEKDALLQRILDECDDRASTPPGAFVGVVIDLVRKLGKHADDLVKHLEHQP